MGIDKTKGHRADQMGIRGHSCGEVFPFVIYAQGTFDDLWYWVLQPNGLRIGPFKEPSKAEAFAKRLKMSGQLSEDDPATPDIIQRETEQQFTYYRDQYDTVHSAWRWRIPVSAGADDWAEFTSNSGKVWEASSYKVSEIRTDTTFVSIGDKPQWQE